MDIANKIKDLIESKINNMGYILDEVLYVKEDGNYFLRIIIDKNEQVDPLIDKVDYLKDSYILDVCSKEKGCEKYE